MHAGPASVLPAGIAIIGPTGSGKSALALRIAASLPVEIISVDSAQVYRGLDVGTAKPTREERQQVVHHLVDIRDPDEVYSAGEFRDDCLRLVHDIVARGRTPLLVGGTMLYYRALFGGIAGMPTADATLRAAIDARAAREGWPALHAELAARDAQAGARIHPNDAQRIQRALEVLELSGRGLDSHWEEEAPRKSLELSRWQVALLEPADRARLHEVLAMRLDAMLRAGFIEEVRALLDRGFDERMPVMRLVGYRQLIAHAQGLETQEIAAQRALFATRQLAKRQLTWMRSGKVLPYGATIRTADPFDSGSVELLAAALIEAPLTP